MCHIGALPGAPLYDADGGMSKLVDGVLSDIEKLQGIRSEKIREVRGLGLMLGIELKEKVGRYVQQLMKRGVIVLLAGATVIRLLPPLVITKEEIDIVVDTLQDVLG